MFLPKETCSKARAREQESAEAIVALRPSESTAERRAEGTTAKRPGSLWTGKKTTAQTSAARGGVPRHSARTRTALMVQSSQAVRSAALRQIMWTQGIS